MLSASVPVQLTDDELWHAIVQNTDSMSVLIHHQVDLEAGFGANDPNERARLMRANQQQIDRFAREYAACTAELRRRHGLLGETEEAA